MKRGCNIGDFFGDRDGDFDDFGEKDSDESVDVDGRGDRYGESPLVIVIEMVNTFSVRSANCVTAILQVSKPFSSLSL